MKKFCSGEIVPRWSFATEGSADMKSRELPPTALNRDRILGKTQYSQVDDLRSSLQEANAA